MSDEVKDLSENGKNTIEKLKRYSDYLDEEISNESQSRFLNSDRGHNAIVLQKILDHSCIIKMYCGEFSIFKKKFKEHVDENIDKPDGQYPMNELYTSFKNFLEKQNSSLEVIMEDPKDNFWEQLHDPELIKEYMKTGKLKLYRLKKEDFSKNKGAYHFTIGGDKIYRREIQEEDHMAIGSFNHEEGVKLLSSHFDLIMTNSEPFCYTPTQEN